MAVCLPYIDTLLSRITSGKVIYVVGVIHLGGHYYTHEQMQVDQCPSSEF